MMGKSMVGESVMGELVVVPISAQFVFVFYFVFYFGGCDLMVVVG